jgi:hypothetical protein
VIHGVSSHPRPVSRFIRSGDLAYLHVHPHGAPGDGTTRPGPDISFTATAPSAGAYRLFLDFQHEDTVRTAAFTVHAAESGEEPPGPAGGTDSGDHQHRPTVTMIMSRTADTYPLPLADASVDGYRTEKVFRELTAGNQPRRPCRVAGIRDREADSLR